MMHRLIQRMITECLSADQVDEQVRYCFGGGSSGGGNSTTSTTVQKSDPWEGQQPYLKDVMTQAQGLYNSPGPNYYPGQTVQGFTPTQQYAQQAGIGRAMTGSPLQAAGQGEAMRTLNGDYLQQGNPYLANVMGQIESTVMPSVNSQFGGAGRFGSPAHAGTMTSAMTNALAPYAFGSYQNERANMQNMAMQAPGLAAADYNDINALAGIGQQQQTQGQAMTNADIEKHNYEQNLAANKLAQYAGLVGGNYGGTSTGTSTGTQPAPGKGGQLLGGGLAGLGTAGNLGWRPFG